MNKRIVTTCGCFDIIHAGHVNYLEAASRLGNFLFVGLNGDGYSYFKTKPGRPIVPERARLEVVAGLRSVYCVFPFIDEDPRLWLGRIKPDSHVKGTDSIYGRKQRIEWDTVVGNGGRVVLVPKIEGKSTTDIIEKIIRIYGHCSIRKLFHPYFLRYQDYIQGRFSNRKELLGFLAMVRLKEKKLEWALRQKDLKNKELAERCGIGIRRFQQLKASHRDTGMLPKLIKARRPRKVLSEDETALIDKAVEESKLTGAVHIRLYIKKRNQRSLPYNKIHAYLLKKGIAREDKKKQKQRGYTLYVRDHSFSLVHLDWHESKVLPGKWVCAVEDDASRFILAGGEFDNATAENSIALLEQAKELAFRQYSAVIREVNTDQGSQFYTSKNTEDGEKGVSAFEEAMMRNSMKHIPSRRNHPQTNGKAERWFRTYEEKRMLFPSFDAFVKWHNHRIHLGLSRKEGITPYEALLNKLQPESLIGLFFRRFE